MQSLASQVEPPLECHCSSIMATPIPATGSISQSAEAPTSANSSDLVEIPEELSRHVKQKVRNGRRNAFKAWRWTLMGNVDFQLRDQQELASALLQAKQSSVDEHHADDVAGGVESVPSRDTLRAEAVHARQQIKKARKLVDARSSGAVLTRYEKNLCIELETGELEEDRNKKDRAHGHGNAMTSLSIEMAVVLRTFCRSHLERYFLFTRPR